MNKKFKIPSLRLLLKLPSLLNWKEKTLIVVFCLILAGLYSWKARESYLESTKLSPVVGGEYTEGIIGVPRYINPAISQTNEVDEVLSSLIFSSLFKFDSEGKLKNDLVDSYTISEDKTTYRLVLRNNANFKWQDKNIPLNADDVLFTVSVIKNADYDSPLQANFDGVTFEKVDDYTIDVKTKAPFGQTLSLLTFGILSKNFWDKISPDNFSLAQYNLKPVGSGPYVFYEFRKDNNGNILTYQLRANKDYYGDIPFIETINFKFYSTNEEMIAAYNKGEIMAMGGISPSKASSLDPEIGNLYTINMPQYFAVFFNQTKSKPLADSVVRTALAYATDKKDLVNKVLNGMGTPIEGPYLPFMPGYTPNTKIYDFTLEYANNILDAQGWKDSNDDGIRDKGGVNLEFTLTTGDDPELTQTADFLKDSWSKIGAKVEIKVYSLNDLTQNYIKNRDYDSLLFGEVLSLDPNPFVFWHSSERKDPGLNLANYYNKDVDKLLEDAQTLTDEAARQEKYQQFQKLVIDDVPAVFLYSPYYLYTINNEVGGVNIKTISLPGQRLNDSSKWYMNTQRVWK